MPKHAKWNHSMGQSSFCCQLQIYLASGLTSHPTISPYDTWLQ
jgi:hypothetical protein